MRLRWLSTVLSYVDLCRCLQVAEAAAREASDLAVELQQRGLYSTMEPPGDTRSDADKLVHDGIETSLRRHLPSAVVFGEESKQAIEVADLVWVVDAIDGTTNFVRGLPDWCISIALLERNTPVLGVVAAPAHRFMATAIRAGGVLINGRRRQLNSQWTGAPIAALGFAPFTSPEIQARVTLSAARRGIAYRREGSGALALALVANAQVDVFVQPSIEPWDAAAGCALVTESGGTFLRGASPAGVERGPLIAIAQNACAAAIEWAHDVFATFDTHDLS